MRYNLTLKQCSQTKKFPPLGFIAERWEFDENQRAGNTTPPPFSVLALSIIDPQH